MPAPEMLDSDNEIVAEADRRKFLATCGKFAVVTPPAITMLLSTSLTSTAIAGSAGPSSNGNGNGNGNGNANGHHDGKGNNG
jgi:hypothetical protein